VTQSPTWSESPNERLAPPRLRSWTCASLCHFVSGRATTARSRTVRRGYARKCPARALGPMARNATIVARDGQSEPSVFLGASWVQYGRPSIYSRRLAFPPVGRVPLTFGGDVSAASARGPSAAFRRQKGKR
jgi:hypothetical protein